jgi:hypothetical protein
MDDPRHAAIAKPKGWLVQKVLWKVSRDYRGPVWIRGSEVSAAGGMKFSGTDTGVVNALRFHAGDSKVSEVFVPHAGCYAWHIRGRGFHVFLVFRAVCLSAPGYRPCM